MQTSRAVSLIALALALGQSSISRADRKLNLNTVSGRVSIQRHGGGYGGSPPAVTQVSATSLKKHAVTTTSSTETGKANVSGAKTPGGHASLNNPSSAEKLGPKSPMVATMMSRYGHAIRASYGKRREAARKAPGSGTKAVSTPAKPATTLSKAFTATGKSESSQPKHPKEVTVEVETRSDNLWKHTTTSDGTVGPILKAAGISPDKAPKWLKDKAAKQGIAVEKVSYDKLPGSTSLNMKRRLLAEVTKGQKFFSNRKLPGVLLKEEIAKQHGVNRYIELGGAETGVNFFELHFRQQGNAGDVVNRAFKSAVELGCQFKAGHIHMTAPLPKGVQEGKPFDAFVAVDQKRRMNTVQDFGALLGGYRLGAIKSRGRNAATYFDYMTASKLQTLNRHYDTIGNGHGIPMGKSTLKMGSVGVHPGSFYDGGYTDQTGEGIQVRVLRRAEGSEARRNVRTQVLNDTHQVVYDHKDGISKKAMMAYYETRVGPAHTMAQLPMRPGAFRKQGDLIGKLHYNRDMRELLNDAPKDLQPLLTKDVRNVLTKLGERNIGLKTLVHSWSNDTALAGNPKAKAKVIEAQKVALKGVADVLKKSTNPESLVHYDGVIKGFLLSSGLVTAMKQSLHASN